MCRISWKWSRSAARNSGSSSTASAPTRASGKPSSARSSRRSPSRWKMTESASIRNSPHSGGPGCLRMFAPHAGRRGRDQREQQRQELRESVHAAILGPCRARRKAAGEDLLGEQPVAFRGRRCGSHAAERGSGALPTRFTPSGASPAVRTSCPVIGGAYSQKRRARHGSCSLDDRPRVHAHGDRGRLSPRKRRDGCRRDVGCHPASIASMPSRTRVRRESARSSVRSGPARSNSPARSSRQPRTDAVGGSGSP
jgi:hypothetical protein